MKDIEFTTIELIKRIRVNCQILGLITRASKDNELIFIHHNSCVTISPFGVIIEAFIRHEFLNVEIKAQDFTERIEVLIKSSEEEDFILFPGSMD